MAAPIQPSPFDRMLELRHDPHRHPEPSWKEHRTTERLISELDRLGALPIQEETGLSYPTGTLVAVKGAVNASTDAFHILMRGRRGQATATGGAEG